MGLKLSTSRNQVDRPGLQARMEQYNTISLQLPQRDHMEVPVTWNSLQWTCTRLIDNSAHFSLSQKCLDTELAEH